MRRWIRHVRLSELYMWVGAIFTIGVVVVAEMNRGPAAGQPSAWAAFFPQLTATLVGGALAGFVAYGLNRRSRVDVEKDAAIRFIIKLKLIADDFHSVVKTMEQGLVEANSDNMTGLMMWQRVRPIVGLGDAHLIDADEAASFLSRGYSDLANRALLVAVRHRTFLAAVQQYNQMRLQLSWLVPPTEVDGPRASAEVPREKLTEFRIRSNEIEDLIRDIFTNARTDGLEARTLCSLVGPAAQKMFADKGMPTLEDVT